jgi:hypothetical protein
MVSVKQFAKILLAIVLLTQPVLAGGHQRLVAQSGIRPHRVGTHEGVGVSSRSREQAIRNCCYWGQLQPVSIQTSFRNGFHYAVVRYR